MYVEQGQNGTEKAENGYLHAEGYNQVGKLWTWHMVHNAHFGSSCFAWMKGLPNASDNKTGREWDEYGEVMHE